ncbi:MAG: hypothetical protein Q7V14_02535, partial [Coriobacteriia bacterium]|nr:hypothetical protein [Coriobacteriia bacterium]
MKRISLTIAATMLALVVGVISASAGAPAAAPNSRVVMVLTPYLSWSDITTETPTLRRIAEQGAVANINVRNRNRASTYPGTAEQGALTFSAGAWAAMDDSAPSAYSVEEVYNEGTAAEAFARLTGLAPSGADIVFLGLPRVLRHSVATNTLDVVPGTLGGEIIAAGGTTAAIGNGDPGRDIREVWHNRAAALVAMDYNGLVPYGDLSSDTLRDSILEPFGVAMDVDLFMLEYADVERSIADTQGPALVVLDPGDLARAAAVEGITSPIQAEAQHTRAVITLDLLLERVLETLPQDAILLVATPVEAEAIGSVTGLAPLIAYGPGFSGYLTSSSTHRTGLTTNLDIAATVLSAFEIERPVQVLGNPIVSVASSDSLDERIAALVRSDATAVSIDATKSTVINGFIAITLGILLASTFVLLRARRWHHGTAMRMAAIFRIALLGILALPPATLLMFIIDSNPQTPFSAVSLLAVCTLGLWVLALIAMRYLPMRVPVGGLSVLMMVLLLVDQWVGAPWSFTSFLGYSPLLAARYYGIGNEGAALLLGASLVGVAFLMDQWPRLLATQLFCRWGVPVLGVLVVGTCAAPFLGANVGVAVWGVVGFAVAWALMNGHRITWKVIAASFGLIVLFIAVFSFVDLGSSSSQTHL